MKKIIIVLLLLALPMLACGGAETTSTGNKDNNSENSTSPNEPDSCPSLSKVSGQECDDENGADENVASGEDTDNENDDDKNGSGSLETCDNEADDDNDSAIDCYDSDCASASGCQAGETNSDADNALLQCQNYTSPFNSLYIQSLNECDEIVPSLMAASIYSCEDGYLYSRQISLDSNFPFDTGILPIYVLDGGATYITFDPDNESTCDSYFMYDDVDYYIGIACYPKTNPASYCTIIYNQPSTTVNSWSAIEGYYIVAQDGQYLGEISSNKYDSDSICDQYGTYGSKYSYKSIFNNYSKYGNNYSSYSAYNSFAYSPPIIYDTGNNPVYYLTKNDIKIPAIDPDELVNSLGCPR